jgi:enoyl-CoA hydratase/carnithine racemase
MSTSSLIELRCEDGVATITLNRPEKRNAITDDMRTELIAALEQVTADRAVRAVILTGNGKGFCAGGDVAGMQRRMEAEPGDVAFNGWARQQRVHRTVSLLYKMPKPTFAAVNGGANGLGADMALSCDFVIASEEATFAWSYIKRGLIPDGGGMYFLPRRVGIADRVSKPDALLADAHAWAKELSAGSAAALALGKSIMNQSFELSADQVFAQGSQAQAVCYTTTEHRESVLAFLNAKKG